MFKLPEKWRIHNVFQILLLAQNTTRKGQVDKNITEFEAGNNKKYKMEAI